MSNQRTMETGRNGSTASDSRMQVNGDTDKAPPCTSGGTSNEADIFASPGVYLVDACLSMCIGIEYI